MNNIADIHTAEAFIKKHFIKSDTKQTKYSAYALKHILQNSTNGIYMTEKDFVGLMDSLGYKRGSRTGRYKIILSKEVEQYIKEDGRLC